MSQKNSDRLLKASNPILWGIVATGVIVVLGIVTAFVPVCETDFWGTQTCGTSKWSYFLKTSPNEVGDTLAGFAGALAFVWLITTVWLQAQELSAQRKELKLARIEIESEKMATSMEAQAEIFKDEKIARDEMRRSMEFEELLLNLARKIELAFHNLHWVFELPENGHTEFKSQGGEPFSDQKSNKIYMFSENPPKDLGAGERVFAHAQAVIYVYIFAFQTIGADKGYRVLKSPSIEIVKSILSDLQDIERFPIDGKLMVLKSANIFLEQMRESVENLLDLDIWVKVKDVET